MAAYGLTGSPSDYQEDHLISLELGGHPTDPRNLWPEPYPRAAEVDQIENELNDKVCSGELTLAEAQQTGGGPQARARMTTLLARLELRLRWRGCGAHRLRNAPVRPEPRAALQAVRAATDSARWRSTPASTSATST